jgi:hypothetical protein
VSDRDDEENCAGQYRKNVLVQLPSPPAEMQASPVPAVN